MGEEEHHGQADHTTATVARNQRHTDRQHATCAFRPNLVRRKEKTEEELFHRIFF